MEHSGRIQGGEVRDIEKKCLPGLPLRRVNSQLSIYLRLERVRRETPSAFEGVGGVQEGLAAARPRDAMRGLRTQNEVIRSTVERWWKGDEERPTRRSTRSRSMAGMYRVASCATLEWKYSPALAIHRVKPRSTLRTDWSACGAERSPRSRVLGVCKNVLQRRGLKTRRGLRTRRRARRLSAGGAVTKRRVRNRRLGTWKAGCERGERAGTGMGERTARNGWIWVQRQVRGQRDRSEGLITRGEDGEGMCIEAGKEWNTDQ